jgi:hypothetical protein
MRGSVLTPGFLMKTMGGGGWVGWGGGMTRADSYLGRAPQWGIYVDKQRGARRGVIPPAWVAAGGLAYHLYHA